MFFIVFIRVLRLNKGIVCGKYDFVFIFSIYTMLQVKFNESIDLFV